MEMLSSGVKKDDASHLQSQERLYIDTRPLEATFHSQGDDGIDENDGCPSRALALPLVSARFVWLAGGPESLGGDRSVSDQKARRLYERRTMTSAIPVVATKTNISLGIRAFRRIHSKSFISAVRSIDRLHCH